MAKKNNALRAASTLLVAVLLSTCAISGTFAKYVTTGSGSDFARVAKWGVQIATTDATFAETYAADDVRFTLDTNTVVSTEDVVAPGTSGEVAAFTITGIPETACRLSFVGDMELGDNWVDANGAYYCPIEITVLSTHFSGLTYNSADEFEDAVNAKITEFSADYAAGRDLGSYRDIAPEISWRWPFSTGGENDVKDTYLGNQAAAGNAATISLSVSATVTQID